MTLPDENIPTDPDRLPAETYVAEVRMDPTGVVFDDLGDAWVSSDTVVNLGDMA